MHDNLYVIDGKTMYSHASSENCVNYDALWILYTAVYQEKGMSFIKRYSCRWSEKTENEHCLICHFVSLFFLMREKQFCYSMYANFVIVTEGKTVYSLAPSKNCVNYDALQILYIAVHLENGMSFIKTYSCRGRWIDSIHLFPAKSIDE